MSGRITAVPVASDLGRLPVFLAGLPGDPDQALVLQKGGLVRRLDLATGAVAAEPFLDLSAEVSTDGEMGLLGLAFAPDFAASGRFYLSFSNLHRDTEIRAYAVSAGDPHRADPAGATPVLTIPQAPGTSLHRAGWLGFGPDGLLYVTIGDGEVPMAAHDTGDLRGKILRLEVGGRDDFPEDPGRNYAIPEGNPFAGAGDPGADEIRAYGFRNPWRASFDPATGRLFLADVGEDAWEEVNLIHHAGPYGWPFFEGTGRFWADAEFPTTGFNFPIFVYAHEAGDGRSVIGGHVYRGPGGEGLQGAFLFGDFISGRIWALSDADGDGTWERELLAAPTGGGRGSLDRITSFGADAAGRLYALDAEGEVFRLDPAAAGGLPALDAEDAVLPPGPAAVDWDAVAARVQANFAATGQWFA